MSRIFLTLAWFALIMMSATLVLGLWVGDLHVDRSPETLRGATVHRLFGVATGLVVVLVHSIVVTYFIGTSRWCKEVVAAYHLNPEVLRRSTALKRRTFPWALLGMLAVVGVVALGGAADPATGRAGTENWVTIHLLGAMVGLAFIAWTFFIEWQNIQLNHLVIADILAEVRRIREEKGLEV